MYIAKTSSTTVDVFFNRPEHNVDWTVAAPGKLVVQLSKADFNTVILWRDAGQYINPIPPQLITDSEDRNPGDPGYVDTWSETVPGYWESDNNQIVMLTDGSVELRDSEGTLDSTLTGTVVQNV